MKLNIDLTLRIGWVKLESCSRDLLIVCIYCLFWQKDLVFLDIPISTAAWEQPGKIIVSNSSLCMTSGIFLLVYCHFSTCANPVPKAKAARVCALLGLSLGLQSCSWCLDAEQNRNPAGLSDPGFCLQSCWLWGNPHNNLLCPETEQVSAKNKPGAHAVTLTNTSTASFAEYIMASRRLLGRQKGIICNK